MTSAPVTVRAPRLATVSSQPPPKRARNAVGSSPPSTLRLPASLPKSPPAARLRTADRLLASAIQAVLGTGDLLHNVIRNHGCDRSTCDLCREARLVCAVLAPLETGLEGEYWFPDDPALDRRRKESAASRARPRRRRRTWRPDHEGNYSLLTLTLLSLCDLSDALDSLRAGHGCGGCYSCQDAEVYGFLTPMLSAALEYHNGPSPSLVRRRGGFSPEGAQVLRLMAEA